MQPAFQPNIFTDHNDQTLHFNTQTNKIISFSTHNPMCKQLTENVQKVVQKTTVDSSIHSIQLFQSHSCFNNDLLKQKSTSQSQIKQLNNLKSTSKVNTNILSSNEKKIQSQRLLVNWLNKIIDDFIEYLIILKQKCLSEIRHFELSDDEVKFITFFQSKNYEQIGPHQCLINERKINHSIDSNFLKLKQNLQKYWKQNQTKIKDLFNTINQMISKEKSEINKKKNLAPSKVTAKVKLLQKSQLTSSKVLSKVAIEPKVQTIKKQKVISSKILATYLNIGAKKKEKTTIQAKSTLNSKIVSNKEEQVNLQKMLEDGQTNTIKEISLLYRASQNEFSSREFHKKCDKIEHTLTLILTEHGKKIGGYTPLKWDRTRTNKYDQDPSGKSFIFSLTNNHKFTLSNRKYAIYVNSSYGPTFGGGKDLWIFDKSNKKYQSQGYVGSSYTHPEYKNGEQASYTKFSGAINDGGFKVDQWEIFEIKWN